MRFGLAGLIIAAVLASPSAGADKPGTGEEAARARAPAKRPFIGSQGTTLLPRLPGRRLISVAQQSYWMREYKRRWLLERRNGVLRARTVRRLRRQLAQLRPPPLGPAWLVNAFLCIHRGEGAWNANTGNGYYGGLQMDWSFMRSYGEFLLRSKGTADRWTPAEQIRVAMRAYHSGRGFYPWPTTARRCGLL